MYSTDEVDRAVPADVMSRGRTFADEAVRILGLEMRDTEITLPMAQGILLLWIYEANIGDGNLGLRLLDHAHRFYSLLLEDMHARQCSPSSSTLRSNKFGEAIAHFAWGFYCVAAYAKQTTYLLRFAKTRPKLLQADSYLAR
jgi:hypothetical protein